MNLLVGGKEQCSLSELEKTYEEKKSKYQNELKHTSAKPRIRLLEAKIQQLDTLYRATREKIELNCDEPEVVPSSAVEPQTGESTDEEASDVANKSVGSPSMGNAFPICLINGELREVSFLETSKVIVDEEEVDLEQDGSLSILPGNRKIKILHPFFEPWETELGVLGGKSFPLIINMIPLSCDLTLKVFPSVDFRLFLNELETPRKFGETYKIPLGELIRVKLVARGYEEAQFTVCYDQVGADEKSLRLCPLLENTDLVSGELPLTLSHMKTGVSVDLRRGSNFVFGRAESCDVKLSKGIEEFHSHQELFISRNHFSVTSRNGRVFLQDHSANGTKVNAKKITEEIELPIGQSTEVEVFWPGKKGHAVRRELFVHGTDYDESVSQKIEAKFIAVYQLAGSQRKISHLLFFENGLRERQSPKTVLPWVISVTKALGAESEEIIDEARMWAAC